MKTIKTTLTQFRTIEYLAKQKEIARKVTVKVTKEFKRGGVQVTAPIDFLTELGF